MNLIEELGYYFEGEQEYTLKLEELQNNIDMIVSLLESPHKERFKYLTTWRVKDES